MTRRILRTTLALLGVAKMIVTAICFAAGTPGGMFAPTLFVGAMIGARGCITNPVTTMPRQVIVAVVWQGMRPTVAPGGTTCGQNQYGAGDKQRRAMIASITIGCLQDDPTTGTCVTP